MFSSGISGLYDFEYILEYISFSDTTDGVCHVTIYINVKNY